MGINVNPIVFIWEKIWPANTKESLWYLPNENRYLLFMYEDSQEFENIYKFSQWKSDKTAIKFGTPLTWSTQKSNSITIFLTSINYTPIGYVSQEVETPILSFTFKQETNIHNHIEDITRLIED